MFNFFTGGNTFRTPQDVERMRRQAYQMTPRGANSIGGGFNALGNGLVAGILKGRANAAEKRGQESASDDFQNIFSTLTGDAPKQKQAKPAKKVGGGSWKTNGTKLRTGIEESAAALGIDPVDLATAISYETAGTFSPTQKGPTTKWGQHRGLIQFGQPQAKQFGVDWDNPAESQLGADGAVVKYLKDAGVQPGMGLMDIYSAINAGGVGLYHRSDVAAGGAPGTVADKVNNQMAGHRAKAETIFGNAYAPAAGIEFPDAALIPRPGMKPGPDMRNPMVPQAKPSLQEALMAKVASRGPMSAPQAPQTPNQRVAGGFDTPMPRPVQPQAMPPQIQPGAQAISQPSPVAATTVEPPPSPAIPPQVAGAAQAPSGQQWFQIGHPSAPMTHISQIPPEQLAQLQGGQARPQMAQQAPQQRGSLFAPRPQAPQAAPQAQAPQQAPQAQQQAGGVPSVAQLAQIVSNPWTNPQARKVASMMLERQMAAGDPMAQIELQKARLELEQMQQPEPGHAVLTAEEAQQLGLPAGAYQRSPDGKISQIGKSGVTVNIGDSEVGKIPAGFEMFTDPETGGRSMRPIEGGPAAIEAAKLAETKEIGQESKARSGNIVIEDIDRALVGLEEGSLPTSGPIGGALSNVPGTQAFDVGQLIETIRANSGFDRLQAMRDSSPTGGALGAINQSEMALLQAALGNLSQSQSGEQLKYNLKRVRRVYDEIINGPSEKKAPVEIDGYTIEQVD